VSRPNIEIVDFGGDRNAPVLVLGPSLGTSVTALWSAAAVLLTGTHRVLGWDLPGHGVTPASCDNFTLSELAYSVADRFAHHSKVSYAGVSVGGAVGLQILLDHSIDISAAALICNAARIGEPAAWRERARTVRRWGTVAMLSSAPQRWFAPGFVDRDPNTAAHLLASLQAADNEGYAAICQALANFDVVDRLTDVAVPVVVIAGSHDIATPSATLRELPRGIAARYIEVPEAGHLAPAEQPGRIVNAVATVTDGSFR
jgi:3-oxoadipate enol-lactonase / 4-carboxymuconolactone decarboxylase